MNCDLENSFLLVYFSGPLIITHVPQGTTPSEHPLSGPGVIRSRNPKVKQCIAKGKGHKLHSKLKIDLHFVSNITGGATRVLFKHFLVCIGFFFKSYSMFY
jgi:hypothetical protein